MNNYLPIKNGDFHIMMFGFPGTDYHLANKPIQLDRLAMAVQEEYGPQKKVMLNHHICPWNCNEIDEACLISRPIRPTRGLIAVCEQCCQWQVALALLDSGLQLESQLLPNLISFNSSTA